MIKPKRLIQMARKWRNVAEAAGGGGNKQLGNNEVVNVVAEKGHFVMYTIDKRRFMIPLKYLHTDIFKELFRMSEEVFGLPGDGPITLPCDALFMEYVVSTLLQPQHRCKDSDKALLISLTCTTIAGLCCLSSISFPTQRDQRTQQLLLDGF
ncbi:Auxin-induced protein [Macleaya cordata]|uniref:Auxin-induced protein n=1 Tax=Macleaya cordata TaxID=56857 RepID=A0A200R024_MACCD|nr:Auxin-induced protein [Macleaya cordata]